MKSDGVSIRKVLTFGIILALVIASLLSGLYFFPDFWKGKKIKYITVRELWGDLHSYAIVSSDTQLEFHYWGFKSYDVGDYIYIKDTPINITEISWHKAILNYSNVVHSKILNEKKTCTAVGFKSGWGLIFDEDINFKKGKEIVLTYQVKKYKILPIIPVSTYGFCFGECISPLYNILEYYNLGVIEALAKAPVSLNLSVRAVGKSWADIRFDDDYSRTIHDYRVELLEGKRVIQNYYMWHKCGVGHIAFIKNYNASEDYIYYQKYGWYAEGIDMGDFLHIFNLKSNTTYTLRIYWRYTWPEPPYDKERIVGEITFTTLGENTTREMDGK